MSIYLNRNDEKEEDVVFRWIEHADYGELLGMMRVLFDRVEELDRNDELFDLRMQYHHLLVEMSKRWI